MKILVTGAGGFIGHHLVTRLKSDGHYVRGVDIKVPEYEDSKADDFWQMDLRYKHCCDAAVHGMDQVYSLAADMGGIGYITSSLAKIAHNNTLINLNMLDSSWNHEIKKYLYSSSACVYNQSKQHDVNVTPLKEEDAWPADPEKGYGMEKLYAEELCKYYMHDFGFKTHIVRFHNVYGEKGTFDGGKEKAPAALCRKIALCPVRGEIEIWGDGNQTRSFMYISDCVEGLVRLMASEYYEPLNLGTDELVSINDLAGKISGIANKEVYLKHILGPQGVRGRNSDNSKLREILLWEPSVKLNEGLVPTFNWIRDQIACRAIVRA